MHQHVLMIVMSRENNSLTNTPCRPSCERSYRPTTNFKAQSNYSRHVAHILKTCPGHRQLVHQHKGFCIYYFDNALSTLCRFKLSKSLTYSFVIFSVNLKLSCLFWKFTWLSFALSLNIEKIAFNEFYGLTSLYWINVILLCY